ncbi:PREDICTED: uncharacterized protein LOC104807539 isoform X2 [Tarenaya hassleriana]|uniref:uncharacterized protein LOC104807539 isoform X2 n=1 Tax=Tarenaya hassleriana TaxID=28532 RepID=UPI0008FD5F68|nr:PREDICTED: uncharacterized protein LOC104807539 isoform X2 [Tarenaya hassleriana]
MGLVPLEGFAKAKKVKQIAEIYIKLVELKKRREVANVCFICSIGSCVHILHISFFPFLVSLLVTCCINSESNIKGSGASLALSLLRKVIVHTDSSLYDYIRVGVLYAELTILEKKFYVWFRCLEILLQLIFCKNC